MAQCYSESKHFPAAGSLKFYNGAFADDSAYRSGGGERLFEHFHERGVNSGHRRTYTEFGLPRDMNGKSRSFDHAPQKLRDGGLSREKYFNKSSTDYYGNFKQRSNISNEDKLAAAGTLRDFGTSDSNKLGYPSRSSLKREEMVPAEAKPMHRDKNSAYESIIPNSRSSFERSSKEQKTDKGSFDHAELQSQRRSKANTVTSKIKTIPRPYGATTAKEILPEDEYVSGRSTRSENRSGRAATGGFANTNFEREHKIENTFYTDGKSKVIEHRSSSSQGGIELDRNDLRPTQNLKTRPRTRNLSEGNFSNIFAGEDLINGLNERRLHVGSPTRSSGWNASAAGNVRPILYANRSSISEGGASGGGMYTGESSRWGTGTKLSQTADNPPALLYDGYHDPNSRVISSELSASADRAEIGFYEGVFGAGQQAPYMGKSGNSKQSIAPSQIGEASSNHARVDGVSERLSFGSNTSAENGNLISSKADRTQAGEAPDDKVRDQNLNDGQFSEGRFDSKDGFANGRSGGSDHRPSTKGTLIVGNSSGSSDGRSSLDGNVGAARANFKTENMNLEGDHSTNGRSYALNGFIHPKQENFPKKNESVQHNRAKSIDVAYGNISSLVTGESFLYRKASFTSSKDDPEEVKRLGNELYKKGRFAEALTLYERAIFLAPGEASYHSNRAAALSALGRLVDAVQECKEAIRLDPSYARARRRLASLFLRLGQIEEAKKYFQAAGEQLDAGDKQQIQNIEKHVVKCFEARKIADWKTVLRESDAAVLAGADSAPKVLALKAEALLNLHWPDEAAQVLSIAQRLEAASTIGGITLPDSTVLVVQAQLDMSRGRYQEALKAAEQAAHIQPKNIEVSNFLKKLIAILKARKIGNQLFKAGKYFEACAAYGEGLEADSTNAVLLCNRAACRFSIGLWEKSIEDCDAALEAQPTYIKACLRRAHSYAKLEKWEEALRDFEAVKRELPGNVEVARALFDARVAFHKARGEEVSKTQFGAEVEKVSGIDQFSKAITSPGLAVVQFITRWSERCKQFLPFVDQLCQRYPAVNFLTVDIEEIPYLAKLENVTDVPTLKIYRNGQKVQELKGPSHQDLEQAVQYFTQ